MLDYNGKVPVNNQLEGTMSPRLQGKLAMSRDLMRKIKQLSGASNSTVVLRTSSMRRRSSLQELRVAPSISSADNDCGPGSSDSSWANDFSRKNSTDSRASVSVKDVSELGSARRQRPWSKSNPEGFPLDTIEEHSTYQNLPSILTVEKAAAAKIFLETHFNERLHRPKPRKMRRQFLETQLFYSPQLDDDQKDLVRESFYSQETWHLRETRALKAKSQAASLGSSDSPCAEHYESLKVLGKGSFGVVRLVREKSPSLLQPHSSQVFAMKVIRKSDMLRSSQEGHLRAERDFLVSSEGAHW
jgi:protein-serine/threonine kinase